MTWRQRLWVGIVLLSACGEPTIPVRTKAYDFDFGGDVFHWPPNRLPVRFYAVAAGNLPFLVQRAIGVWEEQFLYDEFRGVLTDDSTRADVIVRWSGAVPPDVPPDTGPPVFACDGLTSFWVDTLGRALDSMRVELGVRTGFTAAQVAACTRRLAIHELGHALGLFQHSPSPADIMAPNPTVSLPSADDRRTAEVLYHTAPTLAPPPRPS